MLSRVVRTWRALRLLYGQTVADRYEQVTIGWNSLYRSAAALTLSPRADGPGEAELPRWINLGYWTAPSDTLASAARALAVRLGEAARLSAGDRVLDVGCGYGDSSLLWAASPPADDLASPATRIVGLNVSPFHARYAHGRSRRRSLSSVAFVVGDAIAIPFRESYFDRIVALECAFHFDTRRRFLEGSFRALRAGGRLAIADVILKPRVRRLLRPFDRVLNARWPRRARRALERFTLCPSENLIGRDEYVDQLSAIGYRDVRIEDISAHVFRPFVRYWRDPANRGWDERFFRARGPSATAPEIYAAAWRIYMRILIAGFPSCEYVIVTAERPAA